ncbi:MAG: DinB family protein [Paracoccaceae bacterium]
MKAHFEMLAGYNAWANGRLYDGAFALSEQDYRQDLGAAFSSLHGTLNHMFVADVIWLARFRGQPNPPWTLDHVPHEDRSELRARREALDRDIQGYTYALSEHDLERMFDYRTINKPQLVSQVMSNALAHFFNHQTHHRGQCHALLTRLTGNAPALDLLYYQREV